MKNLKVGTKIMIGFGAVIVILIVISLISYMGLKSAANGFTSFESLARINDFSGHLQANVLQTRMSVRAFFMSGSEADLAFSERDLKNLVETYEQGEREIKDSERMEKLTLIKATLEDYHKDFDEIVRLTKLRDNLRISILDTNGKKMREAITGLMDSTYRSRNLDATYSAGELQQHLLLGRLYLYKYLDTIDEPALTRSLEEFAGIAEHVTILSKDLTNQIDKNALLEFLTMEKIYLTARDDLVKVIKQREDLLHNYLFKNGQIIADAGEFIRISAGNDQDALGLQVSANNSRTILSIIIFSLVSLIIAVVLAMIISRQITRPVNQALEAVIRIAAGNLSGGFAPQSSNDEIGQLIGAMNHMVMNLKKQAGGLAEAVNVLSSSASEIVATTTQLAANASETAVSATETTTTVEEVRQTATVSSQKAKHVSESAQKAAQIAKAGKKAVEDTMEGMSSIKLKMESVAESIVTLAEQSQAIGEIITAVDDIAEQTNLLAVNASIEAVKAGDQGKGFSVVAQEIKALADQSKQATKRVRAILNDIQKATSKAVMATEEGSKTVDIGARLSVQSGENIQALADAIAEAAQAAVQIAASNQQQLAGMDQVVVAMENVKTASAQNAQGAQQMETATHDLSTLGNKLKELVAWYRLAD